MPSWLKKKSGGDEGDDGNRNALFGNRKDKAPAASNPYANPPADDRYSNAPPAYSGGGGNDRFRQEKSPSVTGQGQSYGSGGNGGNQGGRPGGYGSGGGGYGGYGNNDRFGSGDNEQQNQGPRRTGGYGGLGRTDSNDTMNTDAGRNELFGGAAQRNQDRQQQPGGYGQSTYGQSGQPGAYGDAGQSGGYGAYKDRELTAEEQEDEDISATKQEIRFMKQQDVSSTRNALRLAEQAEATGRDTLARLGAQGERIHNTERNLDMSSSQNRIAEDKARELKTLNKSMFAMHVSNPFTSGTRREERDRKVMETHRVEREQRDATRKAAWESSARGEEAAKGVGGRPGGGGGPGKSTLADRAKYQFEADSEDDEMENEIDNNLDQLHGAASRLGALSKAMGQEIETQNTHIDRIIKKTDKVDDQIAMNRARLDRIN